MVVAASGACDVVIEVISSTNCQLIQNTFITTKECVVIIILHIVFQSLQGFPNLRAKVIVSPLKSLITNS